MTYYSIFYVDPRTSQIREAQATEDTLATQWDKYKAQSALCFRWNDSGYSYAGCHNGPFVEKNPT
jgi:hypothetical protein